MIKIADLNRNKTIIIGDTTCSSKNNRKWLIVDKVDGYYILQEIYRADRKVYTVAVSSRKLFSRYLLD